MLSDLSNILYWWLFVFGIGVVFLPSTKKFFAIFFDQGYLFSKILGILLSSYLVWLLASLKIFPFSKETIWLALAIGLAINILILSRNLSKKFLIINYKLLGTFVLEELIFLTALIFWSYIRGFQPDIQGLEKFMDFGFVNSILRSKYFPPADMWFAGKSINYYYYGHYIAAFLTKLTSIDSSITYNLMIATLFAFTFSLTFSLTSNLVYLWKKLSLRLSVANHQLLFINRFTPILAGFVSAFLISLGANLHPAYYNFKMEILKKPYCNGSFSYWYPDATRYIGYCPDVDDKTIHEFPSYSFIVSDLHGHVSDIPFVLTFLAFCITLSIKVWENQNLSFSQLLISHFFLPFLLAVMYMTNQWDFPIYLLVLGLILLLANYYHFGFTSKTFLKSVSAGVVFVLLSTFLFLPFQLEFAPIVKGIGFVRAHSLPYQLLILWGAPWFFSLTFLLFLFGKKFKQKQTSIKAISTKLFFKISEERMKLKSKKINFSIFNSQLMIIDAFVLILVFVSTILIFIPEIIYVKDIYIPSYHRANTMFKLTYQSFIMFSIGIGYIVVRTLGSLKSGFTKRMLFIVYFLLIAMLLIYPQYSLKGYYGELKSKNYKGLYGLSFLKRLYPSDYQAILWLKKNVSDQPHILEAVGDSYTDYERISMATGLPTIQGWLVHEWLWRGSFDEPGKRASEVQTIYESKDIKQTEDLLKKYKVKYLIVSEMERQKYPNINEENLKKLGKTVFQSGKTTIYELF